MKILKKPKIAPVTCDICGTIFQPTIRNLKWSAHYFAKNTAICPSCGRNIEVTFITCPKEQKEELK